MQEGILKTENTNDVALVFIRTFKEMSDADFENNLKLSKKYFEINANGKIDKECDILLNNLKYKKIPSALNTFNITEYKVC